MVSFDLYRNQKTNFHFEMSFVSGTINDRQFIKKNEKLSRYIQGFEKEQVKFIKTENWTSNSLRNICDKEIDEQDRMGCHSRLIYLMQTIMNGLI